MARTVFDVMADQIVNPKCDDCGRSLPHLSGRRAMGGPFECYECGARREASMAADYADWLSQERPRNRTIHVIPKLKG